MTASCPPILLANARSNFAPKASFDRFSVFSCDGTNRCDASFLSDSLERVFWIWLISCSGRWLKFGISIVVTAVPGWTKGESLYLYEIIVGFNDSGLEENLEERNKGKWEKRWEKRSWTYSAALWHDCWLDVKGEDEVAIDGAVLYVLKRVDVRFERTCFI